jgi:protein-disulfide isomerase
MEELSRRSFSFTKALITAVFVLVILAVGGFTWKIFSYYQDFQSGELMPTATYHATSATAERLAALARNGEGSGELATDDDPSFGPANATITIVAFTDFGCPYSQEESYVLEGITHNTNDEVRVILRDFPLTDLHPGADKAAMAAECAAEQGKYTEMYRILNKTSEEFIEERLLQYALQAGVEKQEYLRCMSSDFYTDEVNNDIADGIAAGVTSTPTLFVNGIKIEGAVPYGILYEAVQSLVQ